MADAVDEFGGEALVGVETQYPKVFYILQRDIFLDAVAKVGLCVDFCAGGGSDFDGVVGAERVDDDDFVADLQKRRHALGYVVFFVEGGDNTRDLFLNGIAHGKDYVVTKCKGTQKNRTGNKCGARSKKYFLHI